MSDSRSLLIFDWDGTLVDSASKIIHCMQHACSDVGLPPAAAEAIKNVIGLGLPESIYALFPNVSHQAMLALKQCYSQRFIESTHLATPFFDGVEKTLAALKDAGFLLAVATGKSRKGMNRALAEVVWRDLFDAIRCADETCSKPNPQMLLELMEELTIEREKALMIGDTEWDLAMASNAQIASIGVTYGAHSKARLMQHAPLAMIEQFTDLRKEVDRWQFGATPVSWASNNNQRD